MAFSTKTMFFLHAETCPHRFVDSPSWIPHGNRREVVMKTIQKYHSIHHK